ncbi:MAG: hypothetical protein COU07_02100 [Candidatus Harrisonbacteria bacterium CG10_big_fil_rev_8_21_14_0_10_40_38]|uniref:Peptidase C39-like domain-containing protein n=1 Tax=Candidatus Harrisonbacteria bacterium CG10_big_fil_rev_8_21_14_0_10_40_38 TaxID=1974583 RepID=A0A2H0US91_9BACT|nr:MAG: hypothetical protein COU07_02100 [Candidatus Harrisonbacteria bacterium CG10_big_fil_rev_8_21_14_0_10_40_38]
MTKKIFSFVFITSLSFLVGIAIAGGKYIFLDTPSVIRTIPKAHATDIDTNSSIHIRFSTPVKRQDITYSIYPESYGEWRFEDSMIPSHLYRELVFIPAVNFEPNTEYKVVIENIKNHGTNQSQNTSFSFKTKEGREPKLETVDSEENSGMEKALSLVIEIPKPGTEPITILNIPVDWQDDPLSCEAASLKMALGFKGVKVSEKEIMNKIGFDNTPHKDGVWGNPNEAYVGNIKGEICKTGYGVYWDPVAKAATHWNAAEVKKNWNIKDLVNEISKGNPVIVWGKMPGVTTHDCSWTTNNGLHVEAYKETHVRLVIGYVGSKENPEKIILNDPLAGRLYWDVEDFLTNWEIFGYNAVVLL